MTAFKQTITPAIVDLIIKAGRYMLEDIHIEKINADLRSEYCPICGLDQHDPCGFFPETYYMRN